MSFGRFFFSLIFWVKYLCFSPIESDPVPAFLFSVDPNDNLPEGSLRGFNPMSRFLSIKHYLARGVYFALLENGNPGDGVPLITNHLVLEWENKISVTVVPLPLPHIPVFPPKRRVYTKKNSPRHLFTVCFINKIVFCALMGKVFRRVCFCSFFLSFPWERDEIRPRNVMCLRNVDIVKTNDLIKNAWYSACIT